MNMYLNERHRVGLQSQTQKKVSGSELEVLKWLEMI
jgi:hypothetical protein